MDDRDAGVRVPVSFDLGRVYATPGAMRAIEEAGQTPGDFLQRHLSNDWGEMDAHDSRLNDRALESGEDRIFSAYLLGDGVTNIWIIIIWNQMSSATYPQPSQREANNLAMLVPTLRSDLSWISRCL